LFPWPWAWLAVARRITVRPLAYSVVMKKIVFIRKNSKK
jgi:hypothetical protein